MMLSNCNFVYLGNFSLSSGNVVITDPYINFISILTEKIAPSIFLSQRVTRVRSGIYTAYHIMQESTHAKYLLVLHESVDIKDTSSLLFEDVGDINCSLGEAICICDEDMLYDTSSCFCGVLEDAYYSSNQILCKLPDADIDPELKTRLLAIASLNPTGYIRGAQIVKALGAPNVWDGFSQFNGECTHWSAELLRRVRSSRTCSAFMEGCVASTVPPFHFSAVSAQVCRNRKQQITGFKIQLY